MTSITPSAPLRYLEERLRQSNLQIPVEAVDDQSLLSLISDGYRRLCEEGQALRTITRIADVIDQAEYTLPDDHYRTLRVYRGGVKQLRIPDSEALEGAQTGYYEYDGHIGISPTPGSGVPPVTTYAEDTFDRVVTAGDTFGPLSGGGEWEKRYLTTLASCDGSTGALATVAAGETVANVVSAETLQDGHFRVTVSWDFNTVATTHEVGVCARQDASNDGYRAVLREEADNTVSIVLVKTVAGVTTDVTSETAGVQYNAGDQWIIDYQIETGTHTITAGKKGTDEDDWASVAINDFSLTAEGAYGVIATSGDAIPPTFRFDDYSASSIPVTVVGGPETWLLYCRDPEPLTSWDDSFDADFPTEFIYALVHYAHYRVATMIGGEGEISKANWHRQEFNQACKDLLDRVNSLDQARIARVQGATQGQRELDPFSPRERFRPSTGGGTGTTTLGSLAGKNKVSITDLDFDVATQAELDAATANFQGRGVTILLQEDGGGVADYQQNNSAAMTSGSAVLTLGSTSVSQFASSDVGKAIQVARAVADTAYLNSQGTLTGIIKTFTSTSQITIGDPDTSTWGNPNDPSTAPSLAADNTITNQTVIWGTDNLAAIRAWYDLIPGSDTQVGDDNQSGGDMIAEPGNYLVIDDGTGVALTILKHGVRLAGQGSSGAQYQTSRTTGIVSGGASFISMSPMTMFQFGDDSKTQFGATIVEEINVIDASSAYVLTAFEMQGVTEGRISHCHVRSCKKGIYLNSPSGSKDASWWTIESNRMRFNQVSYYVLLCSTDIIHGDCQVDIGQTGIAKVGGLYMKAHPQKQDHHACCKWTSGTDWDSVNNLQDCVPTTPNGHRYTPTGSGNTGVSEPTWPTDPGSSVVDGGYTWTEAGPVAAWDADEAWYDGVLRGPVGVTYGVPTVDSGGAGGIYGLAIEHHNDQMDDTYQTIGVWVRLSKSGGSIHGLQISGGSQGTGKKKGVGVRLDGIDDTSSGLTTGCDIVGGNVSQLTYGVVFGPHARNNSMIGVQGNNFETAGDFIHFESGSAYNTALSCYSAKSTATITDDNSPSTNYVVGRQFINGRQYFPHVGAATPTGGQSTDIVIGTGKIWVNDAGTWKSVTIS